MLAAYTKDELFTIAAKLIKRTKRDLAGGLSFGLDRATFKICYPQRFAMMVSIQHELSTRS